MKNGNGTTRPAQDPGKLRRVVVGATVGTALEWYDFFIYGTAAALVFGDLFFSDAVPGAGTLIAFATFGVGFVARPFGGILFGHLGDRIGRRETLIITTLVMGLSTGMIGLLPTYESIGIWAPILLVLLRVFQGLGAGAEFGGASTLLAEHAPKERRGFFCSFAQTGVQIGLVLGTLSFLLVGLLPDDQLNAWGWRVPFLLGFVMIAVALWVRLRVEESPVFQQVQESQTVVKLPIADAIKQYPRSVLVGIGAHVCDTAAAYMYATFTVAYATDQLGHVARRGAGGGGDLRSARDRPAAVLRRALGPHRAATAQPLRRDLHGPRGRSRSSRSCRPASRCWCGSR